MNGDYHVDFDVWQHEYAVMKGDELLAIFQSEQLAREYIALKKFWDSIGPTLTSIAERL